MKQEFLKIVKEKRGFKLLGMDVGGRKIGLALAELEMNITTPFSVIERKGAGHDREIISSVIEENRIAGIVVGVPLVLGNMTDGAKHIMAYVESLKLSIPVYYEDESYTSQIADDMLKATGLKRKKRNELDDKLAAKLILDSFLSF
ncbi:MAG: Holliday junction resolvase RuvX [Alphaproteobacteria bacterium]|nr:Holliday junction resolvase RuvX [Candidatus Jidaibacter sp.]